MLRKRTDDKNPADWFAFAEERMRAADLLWRHEGLTAAGIETLQESVERYLKGYLVAKGWLLKKTHDLDVLVIEAMAFNARFNQFRGLADELTSDFFAQHYPGGDWTDIGQNYQALRRETTEMINLIQQELPQYFSAGKS